MEYHSCCSSVSWAAVDPLAVQNNAGCTHVPAHVRIHVCIQVQNYAGLYQHKASAWHVPTGLRRSNGDLPTWVPKHGDDDVVSGLSPPPVQHVHAFYGVNIPTARTFFLRHCRLFNFHQCC